MFNQVRKLIVSSYKPLSLFFFKQRMYIYFVMLFLSLLQRQRESVEPSILRVLRETYRKPDGTYVNVMTHSIDKEIQRQMNQVSQGSVSVEGTSATGLTQLEEDELYFKIIFQQQFLTVQVIILYMY